MEESLAELLKNRRKEALLAFLNRGTIEFEKILSIALSDDKALGWRAAWLISSNMRKDDARLKEHLSDLIDALEAKEDGHQRELLRIILKMNLEEDLEGLLFDQCIEIWKMIHKDPSVRVTAFKLLVKIIKKYPDLYEEVKFLTEKQYLETLSPGIKRSVQKLVAQLA